MAIARRPCFVFGAFIRSPSRVYSSDCSTRSRPRSFRVKSGKLESISFLGRQMMPGKDGPNTAADQNYLAVYAVEFSDGEALCWLHQDEDGKLAAFRCA